MNFKFQKIDYVIIFLFILIITSTENKLVPTFCIREIRIFTRITQGTSWSLQPTALSFL
jgi:hypothetical protein